VVALSVLCPGPAAAGKLDLTDELDFLFGRAPTTPPVIAFSNGSVFTGKKFEAPSIHSGIMMTGEMTVVSKVVTAANADGSVAWVAGNAEAGCVTDAPDDCVPGYGPTGHATGLLLKRGTEWQWIAWHATEAVSAKDQAKLAAEGVVPDPLTPARSVAGAEDVATLFEQSFADAKLLGASVSKRKDVVLYGSGEAERFVGGAQVAAKLKGWNLVFKVRDGLHAGVVGTNKDVAWVAANVDATSKARSAKPSVYRVLAIYEKANGKGDWKLVQLHFSVDAKK